MRRSAALSESPFSKCSRRAVRYASGRAKLPPMPASPAGIGPAGDAKRAPAAPPAAMYGKSAANCAAWDANFIPNVALGPSAMSGVPVRAVIPRIDP